MNTNNTPARTMTEEMIIGKNKYMITTHYKENGRETAEKKLLRYVLNRVAEEIKKPEKCCDLESHTFKESEIFAP